MTIRLEGVAKVFPDGTAAVRGIDLEAGDGELLALVGPSGSGKSTLLRMVAGIETPSEGRVLIGGEDVTDVEPQRRDVAMVFQSYALYPHKTVRENLAFGLRMRGHAAGEVRGRVAAAASLLDISELLDRKPAQLSGGQRQRVALGRAIVRRPRAFLLDEPLSNLDPALRHRTRTELARLHRLLAVTTLYVTHDQEEAMTLGQRVAVLRDGRLEQVAPPMELYRKPATRFVASFIGSPAMNLVPCRVERDDGVLFLLREGVRLRLPAAGERALEGAGGKVVLGVRPHDVMRVALDEPAACRGVAEVVEPRGSDVVVRMRVEGRRPRRAGEGGASGPGRADLEDTASRGAWELVSGSRDPAVGRTEHRPGRALAGSSSDNGREDHDVITLVVPPEPLVREGDPIAVSFPPERLHLFDPSSGRRLG